jgi:hypothetical protein
MTLERPMNNAAGFSGRQRGLSLWWIPAVLLIAAGGGALIAWFVISRVDLTLMLRDQLAMVVIEQDLMATARVKDRLDLHLDETIKTQVPVDQPVTIPLDDTLNIIVHFDGEIPLKMDVRLQDSIPLEQVVELDTVVEAYLPELGSTLKIPLRGKVPINTMVPVDLMVPINQPVRLKFTTPVTARIKQDLTVPLRTVIDAEVPIDASLKVPVLNELQARIIMPTTPSRAVITEADLTLPLRTLRLGLEETAE